MKMATRVLWIPLIVLCLAGLPADAATKKKTEKKAEPAPAESTRTDEPATAVDVKIEKETALSLPPAEVTVGGLFRDAEAQGIGDILVPVWQHSTGLLFVNPRASRTDHSEEEYNLGLGYRQLFPKGPFIVGANVYYDYRDTGHSTYNQLGLGLEFLSPWVDARANYYRPENKEMTVANATEQSVAQSTSTQSGWTDPYATEHEIAQSYVTEQITKTVTTTFFFEQYERAMEGYDGEVGVRLPLPIRPESIDARVFGGYYLFDADYGDDIKGFKGRLEVRLLSSFFFDAAVYENKDLTGSDYYVGGRFSLPFDLAALAKGKNPFAEMDSRFKREERPFDARLTEMVMRDPNIRTEISPFKEREDLRTSETKTDKDTWQEDFILMEDVVFVDLDEGARSAKGTAEDSYNNIQKGVDHAYGKRNVYVYDASSAYQENVDLAPGVTLWGSGCLIPGYDGKSFGSGVHPTVDGRSQGPTFTMADKSTLRGFRVVNTDKGGGPLMAALPVVGDTDISRIGVLGNNANKYSIMCNIIEDAREGVLLARQGSFSSLFKDNLVQNNSSIGMLVEAAGNSGVFNMTVDGSRFIDNEIGLQLNAFNYDEASANIRNSQFNNNELAGGIFLLTGNEFSSLNMRGCQANHNGAVGINAIMSDSLMGSAALTGVTANDNDGIGLNLIMADMEIALARVGQSSMVGNDSIGCMVTIADVDMGVANLSGLTASHNDSLGIMLNIDADFAAIGVMGMPRALADTLEGGLGLAGLSLPIEVTEFLSSTGPVKAEGNQGPGIMANIGAEFLSLGAFFDITARENLGGGVYADIYSDDGIAVGLAGSSKNLMEIVQLGSTIAGLFDYDFPVELSPRGAMNINDNYGPGIVMGVEGYDAAIGAMVGVTANDNLGMGAYLSTLSDGYAVSLAARMNTHDTTGVGMLIESEGGDAAINVVADARANDNDADGIISTAVSEYGMAGTVFLSTDPLRALASGLGEQFLGQRIDIPGERFGPVVASRNGGNGITATVDGYEMAFGLFLDTQTSGNDWNGLEASIVSADGQAMAGVLSSDVLLAMLPDLLPVDPIPFRPLGGVVANDNEDCGIRLNVSGEDYSMGYVVGATANGNKNDAGAGIVADIASAGSDVAAGFLHIRANGNANHGIDASLTASDGDVEALFQYVETSDNEGDGLTIEMPDVGYDLYMGVENVVARNNGGDGVAIEGAVDGDVDLLGERIVSVNNDEDGVYLDFAAGGFYYLDFGDELGVSEGQCSIFGNGGFDFNNAGGGIAMAENNWWGVAPPLVGQFSGLVDYTPWLTSDPNP